MADLIDEIAKFDTEAIESGQELVLEGAAVETFTKLMLSRVSQFRDKKNTMINLQLFSGRIVSRPFWPELMEFVLEGVCQNERSKKQVSYGGYWKALSRDVALATRF